MENGDYRFYLGLYSNEALKALDDSLEEHNALFSCDSLTSMNATRGDEGEIYLVVERTELEIDDVKEKDYWYDEKKGARYIKAFNDGVIGEDILIKGYLASWLIDSLSIFCEEHFVCKKHETLKKAIEGKIGASNEALKELIGEKINDPFKVEQIKVLYKEIEETSDRLSKLKTEYISAIGLV